MWILKRNEPHIEKYIQEKRTTFNQILMVQNKVLDTYAINIESIKENMDKNRYSTHR